MFKLILKIKILEFYFYLTQKGRKKINKILFILIMIGLNSFWLGMGIDGFLPKESHLRKSLLIFIFLFELFWCSFAMLHIAYADRVWAKISDSKNGQTLKKIKTDFAVEIIFYQSKYLKYRTKMQTIGLFLMRKKQIKKYNRRKPLL